MTQKRSAPKGTLSTGRLDQNGSGQSVQTQSLTTKPIDHVISKDIAKIKHNDVIYYLISVFYQSHIIRFASL